MSSFRYINKVMSKSDWIKLAILVLSSVLAWTWVIIEFQKPLIADDPTTTIIDFNKLF